MVHCGQSRLYREQKVLMNRKEAGHMKRYNITVNGTTYEVEVEEVKNISAGSPAPAVQQAAAPAQETKPAAPLVSGSSVSAAPAGSPAASAAAAAPAGSSAAAVPEGGTGVKAPVPGTVLDIRVEPGQQVAQGEILVILEAMKMENEIAAPAAGKVASVQAVKGKSVNAGDILVTLE